MNEIKYLPAECLPKEINRLEKWREGCMKKLDFYDAKIARLMEQYTALEKRLRAMRVTLKRHRMNSRIKEVLFGIGTK